MYWCDCTMYFICENEWLRTFINLIHPKELCAKYTGLNVDVIEVDLWPVYSNLVRAFRAFLVHGFMIWKSAPTALKLKNYVFTCDSLCKHWNNLRKKLNVPIFPWKPSWNINQFTSKGKKLIINPMLASLVTTRGTIRAPHSFPTSNYSLGNMCDIR